MFACIYFVEDASLSVVGQLDKSLEVQGNFEPRANVAMKWGKKKYNGVIIKISECEETLVKFANQADSAVLKKLEKKPEFVRDDLFSFEPAVGLSKKRQRKPTAKLVEGQQQDGELGTPKKTKAAGGPVNKDKNTSASEITPQGPPEKKVPAETGRNDEKAAQSAAELTATSVMVSQFQQPPEKTCSEPADKPKEQSGFLGLLQDPDTSLLSTWNLCTNQETMGYTLHEFGGQSNQDPTNVASSKLPAPSPTVLQFMKSLLLPEVQEFCRLFVQHFESQNCQHQEFECFQDAPSMGSDIAGTPFSLYQGTCSMTATPSADCLASPQTNQIQLTPSLSSPVGPSYRGMVSTTTLSRNNFQNQPYCTPTTKANNVQAEPMEESPLTSLESSCLESPTRTLEESLGPKTPLRRSPRKRIEFGQGASKDSDDQPEVLLKDFPSVLVTPSALRTALVKARKSSRPGYTLCYNLLRCVFSVEELATSRGQGILKPKPGDSRLPLDPARVDAVKDYSYRWCKKNDKVPASLRELNTAITEQISHCRKLIREKDLAK